MSRDARSFVARDYCMANYGFDTGSCPLLRNPPRWFTRGELRVVVGQALRSPETSSIVRMSLFVLGTRP